MRPPSVRGLERGAPRLIRPGSPGLFRQVWSPIVAGLLGGLGLAGVYLGIVSLAESPQHAFDLLWEDRALVFPIVVTFAIQLGLYVRVRHGPVRPPGGAGASAAGGGISTVAMAACCAHHVTDLLPIVGVSLAASFLAGWKTPLMVFGLLVNLGGIAVMLVLLRREARRPRPVSSST